MRLRIFVVFIIFSCFQLAGQAKYTPEFIQDTMSIPETGKILDGKYVETTFKNLSVARLFKTNDNKYYLRLIVTKNFYFNKIDVLEIKSGSKSYYAKETKQHKVSKTSGLFVIEVFSNYILTLKNDGITGIVFGKAETDFTNQDASQVKKMADYFYESISSAKQ